MLLIAVPHIDHDDEVEDIDSFNEKDLGEIEAHKSVILHLLSQLKLGMDLTRVNHFSLAAHPVSNFKSQATHDALRFRWFCLPSF